MARTLLKKMIGICCAVDQRFMTITNSIIPVGGYRETAKLAINTRRQLFSQSRVCAVWDDDVFSETIPANPEVAELYNTNLDSHRPNISSVISAYKQPSKSAQSIEITGFIEKSKPSQIIFLYTLLPLTA